MRRGAPNALGRKVYKKRVVANYMVTREPNEGVSEAFASQSSPVAALYEQRDPRHTYYARPRWSLSEQVSIVDIFCRGVLPNWMGGRFIDRRAVRILYVSSSYQYRNPPEVQVMDKMDGFVTAEEIIAAATRGKRSLLKHGPMKDS